MQKCRVCGRKPGKQFRGTGLCGTHQNHNVSNVDAGVKEVAAQTAAMQHGPTDGPQNYEELGHWCHEYGMYEFGDKFALLWGEPKGDDFEADRKRFDKAHKDAVLIETLSNEAVAEFRAGGRTQEAADAAFEKLLQVKEVGKPYGIDDTASREEMLYWLDNNFAPHNSELARRLELT